MKNTLLTFALVLGLGSVFLSSCGTDDGPVVTPITTEKTLDKSKLLDKDWFAEGSSTFDHRFNSDGSYRELGGTWEWLNNSDSMSVIQSSGESEIIVYFQYSTDDEMAFRSGSATSNDRIFKTTVW